MSAGPGATWVIECFPVEGRDKSQKDVKPAVPHTGERRSDTVTQEKSRRMLGVWRHREGRGGEQEWISIRCYKT